MDSDTGQTLFSLLSITKQSNNIPKQAK